MTDTEKYRDLKLLLADAVTSIKKDAVEIGSNSDDKEWGRKLGLCDALATLSATLWILGINEELGLDIDPEKDLYNM